MKPAGQILLTVAVAIGAVIAWDEYRAFRVRSALASFRGSSSSMASLPPAGCAVTDITIKSIDFRFVDECKTRQCASMKGVAVLLNACKEAVGVQVKVVGTDAQGIPVSSRDLWPASTNNMPPGEYTFSLDNYLDFDPRIKRLKIQPIAVQRW